MPKVDTEPTPVGAVPGGSSPYQTHVRKWTGCDRCGLYKTRLKMCFARGSLPCDVLLVGEAPGESENVIGLPFVGPAGHLLDRIMARAVGDPPRVRWAATNIVCCVPRAPDGNKAAAPAPEEMAACAPRLLEFIELARPRLIVCVGVEARDWLDEKRVCNVWQGGKPRRLKDRNTGPHSGHTIPRIDVIHPAAILRMPVAGQGLAVQRATVQIATAVRQLNKEEPRADHR